MKTIELTDTEHKILAMLVGLGLSAFDAPAGPAYAIKRRLEEQEKILITTDDIIKLTDKIKDAT